MANSYLTKLMSIISFLKKEKDEKERKKILAIIGSLVKDKAKDGFKKKKKVNQLPKRTS